MRRFTPLFSSWRGARFYVETTTTATPTATSTTRRFLHSLLQLHPSAQDARRLPSPLPLPRAPPRLPPSLSAPVRWAGTSFMDTLSIDLDPEKSKADAQNRRKRRKRRIRGSEPGEGTGEGGGNGDSAAEGRGAFVRRFTALLDKCEAAVASMVPLNPGMEVLRRGGTERRKEGSGGSAGSPSDCDDSLQVLLGATAADSVVGGGDRGALMLTAEADSDVVTVRLPVSGTLRYRFDERQGRWLNADDGHDLEGIVVRDLLRQCRGFPAF